MAAIAELMKAGIWFDRQKYEEAEYKYQEYLVRHTLGNKSVEVVKKSQVICKIWMHVTCSFSACFAKKN